MSGFTCSKKKTKNRSLRQMLTRASASLRQRRSVEWNSQQQSQKSYFLKPKQTGDAALWGVSPAHVDPDSTFRKVRLSDKWVDVCILNMILEQFWADPGPGLLAGAFVFETPFQSNSAYAKLTPSAYASLRRRMENWNICFLPVSLTPRLRQMLPRAYAMLVFWHLWLICRLLTRAYAKRLRVLPPICGFF